MASRKDHDTAFSADSGSDTITTALPAVARSVREARDLVARLAAAHGACSATVEDVRLAISEAATNVVVHAYESETEGSFRMLATVSDDQLLVTIDDDGRGLSSPARTPGLGAGLRIMRETARQAVFLERDFGGSTVQLRFSLDLPALFRRRSRRYYA